MRVFKYTGFSRFAKKEGITDAEHAEPEGTFAVVRGLSVGGDTVNA